MMITAGGVPILLVGGLVALVFLAVLLGARLVQIARREKRAGEEFLVEKLRFEEALAIASKEEALLRGQLGEAHGEIREVHSQLSELSETNDANEKKWEGTVAALREASDDAQAAVNALKKTQAQLIDSEKLSALGGLVAGVAHEINTPVGIGVTAASHLRTKTVELRAHFKDQTMTRSELTNFLEVADEGSLMILSNLERAAQLIQSFKQVAVDQSSEARRTFFLDQYLAEILVSLKPKFRRNDHKVSIECAEGIEVDSFPGALSQIVTNLVENSLQHGFSNMQGGKIEFHVSEKSGSINLIYRDNGCGMTPDTLARVYEPFFTTKRGAGGSGLGMNLVYNLVVQNLRGRISIKSTEAHGAEFTLTFPANVDDNMSDKGRHGRALVIDDEEGIRSITQSMLNRLGYEVETAESGEKALKVFKDHPQDFDLILLDMVMPGMNGEQTLQRLREVAQEPPIVLASGYAMARDEAQRFLNQGANGFLQKPFGRSGLERAIDEAQSGCYNYA